MKLTPAHAAGEADRRIAQLIQFGTIAAVDHQQARIQVDLGGAMSDWVPWAAGRSGDVRIYSAPSVGEQVVLLSPGGGGQGVALLGVNGAWAGQEATTRLEMPGGVAIEVSGGIVQIAAPGGIEVTGDIRVQGDVIADGVSLKNHVHPGVTRGTQKTDKPE
ncbi:phage baseplate assembly protein V [uncultured Paracoccus sp.]|uniref:phage baseplate assembly protein V n=1 Tax=uncultured Paracoccus sp. TaxID=189685 RepID=UPI0025F566CE|nr:phage baseplate assembly protein V [uncultured Paracoccus sp.]